MSGLDLKRNAVMIDIACNDPDNGAFAHRAEMISVGRQFLELECRRTISFRELGGFIRLSRRKWPILGSKDWIGNWCWNGYWMEIPIAVDFLAWLHSVRAFHCTNGEERIFNLWNGERLFAAHDRDFLARMLGKPSTWSWS